MKRSERNTDGLSLERIWTSKEVDTLWFNSNDQDTYNSIDKTIEFLKRAKAKAVKGGFTEIVVEPTFNENEYGSLQSGFIKVRGYREETDDEYRKRLNWMLTRKKNDMNSFNMSKNYFEKREHGSRNSAYENCVKDLEDAISKV